MSDVTDKSVPNQIRNFVWLFLSSLVIGLLILAIDENPELINVSTSFKLIVIVGTDSIVGFFVYHIWKGRNWARITFLVLFLIGVIPSVPIVAALFNRSMFGGLLSVAQWSLQLYGLYLIFSSPGSLWFKKELS